MASGLAASEALGTNYGYMLHASFAHRQADCLCSISRCADVPTLAKADRVVMEGKAQIAKHQLVCTCSE